VFYDAHYEDEAPSAAAKLQACGTSVLQLASFRWESQRIAFQGFNEFTKGRPKAPIVEAVTTNFTRSARGKLDGP
jgi:hypothetical protein